MAADPLINSSLAERLATEISTADAGRSRAAGVAVALLLTAAPVAVWAGARWTEAGVKRDIAAIGATATPRRAILAARDGARRELEPLLATPGVAATLDALARALPTDASLMRVARGTERRLAIDVSAADPDRLRAALRRDPATAALRDAGQRRGDGGMTVTLEDAR